jgi:AcrR family transcriptional regulator
MSERAGGPDARRAAILDAAVGVFLRYGFKKTSMDDLARAAGLSRQGLYLHFATKEAVFRDALRRFLDGLRAAASRALERDEVPLDKRVVEAFDALHGHAVGQPGGEHLAELLEAARELVGPVERELEAGVMADIARALRQGGVADAWRPLRVSAKELAEHLCAAARGAKHAVDSRDAFRARLRVAAAIVCGGRAAATGLR